MRIEHLQKIIEQVRHQAQCPRCKASFTTANISVTQLNESQAHLSSSCNHCKTQIRVFAEINVKKNTVQSGPVPDFPKAKKILNPQDIVHIRNSIKKFNSSDIHHLFS